MTTIDSAAARLRASSPTLRSILHATAAAFFGLSLAACSTGSSLLGSASNSLSLPSVASVTPNPVPATAAATQSSAQRIAIAPVIGAPDGVAKQIAAELGAALEGQKIALAKAPTDHVDLTLRGYVVSAHENAGTKISYIWDVTDPAGKRVNRITGEELVANTADKDPWSAVSGQIVKTIASKTATSLATWLPTHKNAAIASAGGVPSAGIGGPVGGSVQTASAAVLPVAAATTGSLGAGSGVLASVPSVTGAPGDGSQALANALSRELSSNGVSLAAANGAGAYKVEGKVAVGEGRDGKQPIQIDWTVKDPAGKKLGTVSQKNEIPQGSLDGAWGKTADAAAAAAAQGIIKLLPQKAVN